MMMPHEQYQQTVTGAEDAEVKKQVKKETHAFQVPDNACLVSSMPQRHQPSSRCSLLADTDLEAEVELSKEHQDGVRAEQEAAARREAELQTREAAQAAEAQRDAEAAEAALQERAAAQQVSLHAIPHYWGVAWHLLSSPCQIERCGWSSAIQSLCCTCPYDHHEMCIPLTWQGGKLCCCH